MKPLFEGTFNWYGEVRNLYSHALSEVEARLNMFNQLARRLGVRASVVSQYYKKKGDGFRIVEVNDVVKSV